MADVNTTHNDSPRDPGRRDRIAENTYRRVTKSGMAVFEVVFRDVDGRQRTRRLQARTERAAIREARGVLAGRDGGQRVVPANVTIDDLANDEWFPLPDSLVGSGRSCERAHRATLPSSHGCLGRAARRRADRLPWRRYGSGVLFAYRAASCAQERRSTRR